MSLLLPQREKEVKALETMNGNLLTFWTKNKKKWAGERNVK